MPFLTTSGRADTLEANYQPTWQSPSGEPGRAGAFFNFPGGTTQKFALGRNSPEEAQKHRGTRHKPRHHYKNWPSAFAALQAGGFYFNSLCRWNRTAFPCGVSWKKNRAFSNFCRDATVRMENRLGNPSFFIAKRLRITTLVVPGN